MTISKKIIDKQTIEDAFAPKDECSICGSDYDEECGGVQGHFGITPVTFCEWCYSSIIDMVEQHQEPEPCGMSRK
mgnify:CR=1 FL=1|jgi:hypothetical protein|tara:strand:- start:913 stop:1137 length:225 start_codon:yes stop_codon:yes gene_type:complete